MTENKTEPPNEKEGDFNLERKTTKNECFKSEEKKIILEYQDKIRKLIFETNISESFNKGLSSLVVIVAMCSPQNPWIIGIALVLYFSSLNKLK